MNDCLRFNDCRSFGVDLEDFSNVRIEFHNSPGLGSVADHLVIFKEVEFLLYWSFAVVSWSSNFTFDWHGWGCSNLTWLR